MNTGFRLVRCDPLGHPIEPIGQLGSAIEESCRACADLYSRIGYEAPWVSYISVANGAPVGGGAFVGAPKEGRVEIAYFTLPEFEGSGYATATARGLFAIARSARPDVLVFAKTLPEENASTKILQRVGFRHVGDTSDDDIGVAWLWELPPS